MSEVTFPSEVIDLPSKGKFYAPTSPLAGGQIELKYMTAKEEDILTSSNLIQKGIVLDKLIDSLIITKGISHEDFLIGDLNAVMVASRILGYGKDYPMSITCGSCDAESTFVADLTQLDTKEVADNPELHFTLPSSGRVVKVRLLTRKAEKAIQKELDSLKKVGLQIEPDATTRLRYMIESVDGVSDQKTIRELVDTMRVSDARAFREFYKSVSPDIIFETMFVCESCGASKVIPISIGLNFFWPDARV